MAPPVTGRMDRGRLFPYVGQIMAGRKCERRFVTISILWSGRREKWLLLTKHINRITHDQPIITGRILAFMWASPIMDGRKNTDIISITNTIMVMVSTIIIGKV